MRFLLCAIALALAFVTPARADYDVYFTFQPYGTGDLTKLAIGTTAGEVCSQRSDEEILNGFAPTPPNPITYVGQVDPQYCGALWINQGGPTIHEHRLFMDK